VVRLLTPKWARLYNRIRLCKWSLRRFFWRYKWGRKSPGKKSLSRQSSWDGVEAPPRPAPTTVGTRSEAGGTRRESVYAYTPIIFVEMRMSSSVRSYCDDSAVYWSELATLENAVLAFVPINLMVPTTRTRITASITAYSAISWPSSSDHILFNK